MEILVADDYPRKVERAINLLRNIPQDTEIELSYSGGKDSDVILELAKMAEIPFRAIYKNTTIDPPGTIKHCKSKGVEIVHPKISFLTLIEKKGMPTRRARFCCSELKEYKILDRAIQGIRKCEGAARAARYHEPEICRVYSAKEKVRVYLPILNWTNKDIERFIKERGIQCHPLYYDERGNFRVERRLGCIGCPMQSDNGVSDFKRYPKLLKRVIKSLEIYIANHPDCGAKKKFLNAYGIVYHNLFCSSYDEFITATTEGLFGDKLDPETEIKRYFKI